MSPFDSKPTAYPSSSNKSPSPEAATSSAPGDETQEPEQPGTPVPADDPEATDNGEACSVRTSVFTELSDVVVDHACSQPHVCT